MPSKSAKQARLMRAVAHGWKPDRIKGPTQEVAREFVEADKRRGKVTGYQFGGMASIAPAYRNIRGMMPQYGGVPPQRGGIRQGPTGMMGLAAPWQGPGLSPMDPGWGRGGGRFGGPLAAMRQAMMRGRPGGGGFGRFPGGSGPFVPGRPGGGMRTPGPILNERGIEAWRAAGREPPSHMMPHPMNDPFRRTPTPGRMGTLGGPGYGPNPLGSAGPGGDLRRGRLQGKPMPGPSGPFIPGRTGALSQVGGMPGRRIAPPPGKYPGGSGPFVGGRNPMRRGASRLAGRSFR